MKTQKSTSEKIKSSSHALAVAFKVARIFCFVGIGVLSVGIVYIMLFGNIDLLVLGGKVIVHSPYDLVDIAGMDNWQIIFMSFVGITDFILMAALFNQAERLFRDISVDSSPFEEKHVKRIRKIAVLFFVISLLDFQTRELSFSLTLSLVGVIGALMFWCISLIFEYGCQLQRESDELL